MAANAQSLIKNPSRLISDGARYSANITMPGQQGLIKHLDYLDTSTPLVLRQGLPVVGSVPTLFNYYDNGPLIFKRVMEGFCQSVTGVDVNYSMNTSGYPAGNDSQQLEAPTDMVRAAINPSMVFPELVGNPIWTFMKTWMFLVRNPDTQASSMAGVVPSNVELPPHVISSYAAELFMLQYDTTLRPENMIATILVGNMFPKTLSGLGIQKEMGQAVRPDRTVDFSGIIQASDAVTYVGRNIANIVSFHTLNPMNMTPSVSNSDDILANSSLLDEMTNHINTLSTYT